MTQALPKKRTLSISNDRHRIPNRVLSRGNRVISNRAVSTSLHDDVNDSFDDNAIHFNENKHTILSNFEEWIKLSTDNKITSKNSWQFALIDYFHDLNVIKDGENINFQRALATLDGCVKIYSSRVESAATETGKLLSGLSQKQQETEVDEQQEAESDDEVEDDGKKARKYNRVVESTLVPFETIRIKKLDQELEIDPLFKKALAEFDEGGAKSLLLNTLNIDPTGRVIFDATSKPAQESEVSAASKNNEQQEVDVDIAKLEKFVFKDDDTLENMTIVPSLGEFQSAINDISKAKSILNEFNTKMNAEIEDFVEDNNEFDYNDDAGFDNDDIGDDVSGNDAANNLHQSVVQKLFNETDQYIQTNVQTEVMDRDLMAYFDEKMKANWRGPEHWRVAALKKSKNLETAVDKQTLTTATVPGEKRKRNQQVLIDFFDDDVDEDVLFAPPRIPSAIISKKSTDTNENKLPDDIMFTSSRLTNLFNKPQVTILYFPSKKVTDDEPQLTDENYFAKQYHEQEEQERLAASFHQAEYEDFSNDFGGEDDFGGIDFNDILTADADVPKDEPQVLGRRRTEYVNFSRVAKRVDIRLLKDNLWDTIKKEEDVEVEPKAVVEPKTFGQVVTSIANLYTVEQRKDLSTSFCFICLLHLANEHGLGIDTNDTHTDLRITGY